MMHQNPKPFGVEVNEDSAYPRMQTYARTRPRRSTKMDTNAHAPRTRLRVNWGYLIASIVMGLALGGMLIWAYLLVPEVNEDSAFAPVPIPARTGPLLELGTPVWATHLHR